MRNSIWNCLTSVVSDALLIPLSSKQAMNTLSVLTAHRQHPHVVLQHGGCKFDRAHHHAYCKGSIYSGLTKMGVLILWVTVCTYVIL